MFWVVEVLLSAWLGLDRTSWSLSTTILPLHT